MNYEELFENKGSDTLVFMGGEVKVLGDRKVGGYGVLFSTPKDPDTYEDFFHVKDTDFDIADGEKRSLYYNHGFDEKIGNRKIGAFTTKKDDIGLWVEGQLKEGDEYADAILGMVDAGKLGYSSGAVGHLVRRERVSKTSNVHKITSWPLGEMSLTNRPAEPRAWAIPLKSFFNPTQETPAAETEVGAAVSIDSIRALEHFFHREGGMSVNRAKTEASKFSLRDVEGKSEAQSDTFRAEALCELARIELRRMRELGVVL